MRWNCPNLETKEIIRYPNVDSKHYVKVKDLNRITDLDPNRVVIQVVTSKPKEELDKVLEGYEYDILPEIKKKEGKVVYANVSLEDPKLMLRNHIQKENPVALVMFDEVVK